MPLVVLVDCADAATTAAVAVSLAGAFAAYRAVLCRTADGHWMRVDVHRDATDYSLTRPLPADGWALWITAPCSVDAELLGALATTLASQPQAEIVYFDHDRLDAIGSRHAPSFKSAWDRQHILESNYTGPVVAARMQHLREHADCLYPGPLAQWRMMIEATWRLHDWQVVHVPQVLVHLHEPVSAPVRVSGTPDPIAPAIAEALAHTGAQADISVQGGRAQIRFQPMAPDELVSIVIPTRDRSDLLARCVDTLFLRTRNPRFELVIIDNGSTQRATFECFARIAGHARTHIVADAGPFNFPRLCNTGVMAASGSVVVLLNNDTWILDDHWLDEVTSLARRPDIGAVGPLMVYGDGTLQSAGVMVGVNRTATSVLSGFDPLDSAAVDSCSARRQVSAVLGACLAVSRRKYIDAGGMDERYAVSLNEVDLCLCLRLESRGYANLFTPYARVAHVEGATRGYDVLPEERNRLGVEERRFRSNWREVLKCCDPAHNPKLARVGNPFDIDLRPRPVQARGGWRHAMQRGPFTVISLPA